MAIEELDRPYPVGKFVHALHAYRGVERTKDCIKQWIRFGRKDSRGNVIKLATIMIAGRRHTTLALYDAWNRKLEGRDE